MIDQGFIPPLVEMTVCVSLNNSVQLRERCPFLMPNVELPIWSPILDKQILENTLQFCILLYNPEKLIISVTCAVFPPGSNLSSNSSCISVEIIDLSLGYMKQLQNLTLQCDEFSRLPRQIQHDVALDANEILCTL